jgi:hypothetical protein
MRLSWVYSLLPGKCWNSTLKLAVTASVYALPNLEFILTPAFDALQIMQFIMSVHKPTNNKCLWKKFSVADLQFNHEESA